MSCSDEQERGGECSGDVRLTCVAAVEREGREPPAPTPFDEFMSMTSLEKSPWVKSRIKELRLKGSQSPLWFVPAYSSRNGGQDFSRQ